MYSAWPYRTCAFTVGNLPLLGLLLLAVTAACHERTSLVEEHSRAASPSLAAAATEYWDSGLGYVESVVGSHTIKVCSDFVEMVLRFIAEGAASGLNVIAVYVAEILRATGLGDSVSIPHFTPEGVSSAVKYALLAVIGYWLLCAALRASIALLRRVFWLIKSIIVLWLFVRIISDPTAAPDSTAVKVTLLVIFCAVLSVVTGEVANSAGLENRLSTLEGRVKGMEKKKIE